jgi:flagellin
VAFTVNTNIASMNAQEYLRMNGSFQEKTIARVTSGLRIVSSGDDAAGLAIANGYRSDQAVLTQGIRNANDGLSQLQIIDGGLNNISKLLDRARTLATQSASGAFTGSRAVLNSEFQSVVSEIDRQAQAIGLNVGGLFAKSLSVFIGGGKTSGGVNDIVNGSVAIDMTNATVDSRSLGLTGFRAAGVSGTDIGTGSSTTSVAQILADATNTGSQSVAGFTDFYFRGAGFADDNRVKVSVNLSGVTDTETLATAVNAAIEAAGFGTTASTTAFRNAGIKAAVVTDTDGKQRLSFTSSATAFQVAAGDRTANALMGNFSAGATGVDLAQSVSGSSATAAGTFAAAAGNIIVRFQGSGLASPVDITLSVTGGTTTVAQAIASLETQVADNAALQAAGIATGASFSAGNTLSFTSSRGEQFSVSTVGDITNQLRFGSWQRSGSAFEYTTITGSAAPSAGAATLEISVGGGTKFSLAVTSSATLATAQTNLNAAFAANASASAAGLVATNDGTNLIISSANGTAIRVNEVGANLLGFGNASAVASTASSSSTLGATGSTFNAGGASATSLLNFSAIRLGNDDQTITLSAVDANGVAQNLSVTLRNDATARNATAIDDAIDAINTAIEQSNNATMREIVAVKENDGGTEKIRFLSSLSSFRATVGVNSTGAAGITSSQGSTVSSSALAGGAATDIETQSNAQAAVIALATALSALGDAQAVVGRGQNQFNFAVNLASSQLTNIAASESRIRDADLAQEAANLTKAQIVLQAGIAALAQANSAPQAVLALLRG